MSIKQILRGEIILDEQVFTQQYTTYFSGYCIVVDTETFTDLGQKARIATFAVFNIEEAAKIIDEVKTGKNDIQYEYAGIVSYDLTPDEKIILMEYCKEHDLKCLTKTSFLTKVLFPCLQNGVMLIGHNLPFDKGAICTDFECLKEENCFRLKLCQCGEIDGIKHTHEKITVPCSEHPTVIIKQIKSKKSLMYVEQNDYAPIVDTITLGNALLGAGDGSLNGMVKRYGFQEQKEIFKDYGQLYTKDAYSYAMTDTFLTCKLLAAQYQLYLQHDIPTPFYLLMSEASVGKAYNEKLGIPPFKTAHYEVKSFLYHIANMAYYGGRSEANIRRKSKLVCYTDFKSQYPLCNALINTQALLLAEQIETVNCTEEASDILQRITLHDLQNKAIWSKLCMLVKIYTNGNDILPSKDTVGIQPIYGQKTLLNTEKWCSMFDLIASKIRTGNVPMVLDAYKLVPIGQIKTNVIHLFGNPDFPIDLATTDFFTRVIDLRDNVKSEMSGIKKQLKLKPDNAQDLQQRFEYLSNLQLALKLMANSTSYGILVETREMQRRDIAGKYNAQPVGVHITSAARLLLAIAEQLGIERGISYAFCDTDSFAYALPDGMETEKFYSLVNECIQWFNPLSPFASQSPVFELEDVNLWEDEPTKLYALCISAKRYVLFNKVSCEPYEFMGVTLTWKPRIRKLSEHGLPLFMFDREFPIPDDVLPPINPKWKPDRYLMWYYGILQEAIGMDMTVPIMKWSEQIVFKQTTISTPYIYSWFPYIKNLRPFSFFCVTPMSVHTTRKHRYYMPYARNAKQLQSLIDAGDVKVMVSCIPDYHPTFDMLYERFHDFFSHQESKSANGNEDGYMIRPIVDSAEIEIRTRSGKKIKDDMQMTLFDSDL